MRRLLYVPIIHGEADLGRAGGALAGHSAALAGRRSWQRHGETVDRFWQSVVTYLERLDPTTLKIYQDGHPADGALGLRIVEEAAGRGSRNYQVVRELTRRGAELRKTEDPEFLLAERDNVLRAVGNAQDGGPPPGNEQYLRVVGELMVKRDAFIARTILATLREGELGVLFIGANHKVAPLLEGPLAVERLKDPALVRDYLEELLTKGDTRRLEQLRRRLIAPIVVPGVRRPQEGGADGPDR